MTMTEQTWRTQPRTGKDMGAAVGTALNAIGFGADVTRIDPAFVEVRAQGGASGDMTITIGSLNDRYTLATSERMGNQVCATWADVLVALGLTERATDDEFADFDHFLVPEGDDDAY